jgi:hypothetical protein
MGISKRGSGAPRRPRNPIAKNVRTPQYKPRVEQDKRWQAHLQEVEKAQELPLSEEEPPEQDVHKKDT